MRTQNPVARFRAGQVSCALWENEIVLGGKRQVMLRATIDRRYRDRDGVWKTSQSFSRNEVPLAIYLLQKAFGAMAEAETAQDQDTPVSVAEEQVI